MKNFLLTIAFIILFYSLSGFAQTAIAPSTGNGTSGSPYEISTWENLYWISQNTGEWNKYYIQTANIDFADAVPAINTWDTNKGWTPIGNNVTYFTGTYNGNGKTISGIYINRLANNIGFFGCAKTGTISNLGLMAININGNSSVGGLAGFTESTMISNCYSTGTVIGTQYIGGLIGNHYLGSVSSSFSNCNVTGTSACGGFVGIASGLIQNCYSTGNVTRKSGSTTTDNGGFVGWSNGSHTITKCYSTGRVIYSGTTDPTDKGFLGQYISGTLTNNFWDTQTSLQSTTSGTATGKTTVEMKTQSTFTSAGWDFYGESTNGVNDYWNTSGGRNDGYPFLTWHTLVAPSGSGTIGSPYQIATLENLYWITASDADVASPNKATRWAAYYIQTADINASSTLTWNSGAGWSPIGIVATNFSGTYNGDGHTISGLFINRSATDYQGLFGRNVGTIYNLGVTSVNITGLYGTGGLVGINYGTVYNCYSTGSVTGDMATGGLVGANFVPATIRKSYSNASVTGASGDYGGLVGQHRDGALIADCYSRGNVTRSSGGGTSFGGLVGIITSTSSITNSYSTGRVIYTIGGNPTDKGLVGSVLNVPTFTNNFWDTETSLQTTTAGTATGKTTAEMKTNTTFLSAGWDDTIWNIGDGINNGYPYLDWQNPTGTPLPVELSSFSAATNGLTVMLSWNTATEVNNYGFEVERASLSASPLRVWDKIGFVNGNGNSNSPKNYSFVDDKVSAGKYSYRLKQIDNDGQFEYSKTIEVDMDGVKKYELTQNYPNPFNPTTSIRYAVDSRQFVSLKVFNLLGKEVATLVNENKEAGSYLVNFNASNLSSGVYVYKLQSGSFTQTRKMTLVK